jgi:membrane-associated phospholipid phosphatase
MRVPFFIVFVLSLIGTGMQSAFAQMADSLVDASKGYASAEVVPRSRGEIVVDDFMIALGDGGAFFTAPLRFSGTDWLLTGAFAGGTIGLFSLDDQARRAIGRETTASLNNDFWDIPTRYGVVTYANAFGAATYVTGLISGSSDIRVTGRLLLESLSFSGLSVITARFFAGRSRPYSGDGPWKFTPFTVSNEIQSFPSGHTTVAFAMSTVLAERIDTWWSRVFFYGMAALTAYARVLNNQHWLSDVVVGSAFGVGAGLFVVRREHERTGGEGSSGARILLQPANGGIRVSFVF